VTCDGLRVTQTGLPPSTEFEVIVLNPEKPFPRLREVKVDSDARGRLDVKVRVSLRGLRRVDVEVERKSDEEEFAETGVDLDLPCTPPATTPPTQNANTSRPTGYIPSKKSKSSRAWVPVAIAAAAGVAVGIWLVRRGPRDRTAR
jgi:hypothetical protein